MTELTVLCVDADADERAATCDALVAESDIATRESDSVASAADVLETDGVDCVVAEYSLPDGTGLDVVDRARETTPDTPCILFTDAQPDRIRTESHEDVIVEYLPKDTPGARASLVRLVRNVVGQRTQVGYPLPTREDERLAALEQYDRPGMDASEAFDRITTLARSHFEVEVAFVGLVDAHEERFLACAGNDWETLSREDSMCTHTILQDDVMVVQDTHEDGRFTDNDRLDELDVRAYAGVPLQTPRGATVGAFCLTHNRPRSFSGRELDELRLFADEAMEQLELRRELNEYQADDEGGDDGEADGEGLNETAGDQGGTT